MQILLRYFLFSVLLRTGATFQCMTCEKEGDSNCTSPLQDCNSGENTCLRSLTEVVKGNKTHTKVILACATHDRCKTQFIELCYHKGSYIRRQDDCCKTDGCIPPSTEMPPLNTTENGKCCPVCCLDTGFCSVLAMDCTGAATHCFEGFIKDDLQRPIKGCITESSCNILKTYQGPLIEDFGVMAVTCSEPKSGSGCSSLDVFLLALLPMKLFLFRAY